MAPAKPRESLAQTFIHLLIREFLIDLVLLHQDDTIELRSPVEEDAHSQNRKKINF
jgi:hypothetical protein